MMNLIGTILDRVYLSFVSFIVCFVATLFLGSMIFAVWNITAFAFAFTDGIYTSDIVLGRAYAIMFIAFYFPSLVFIFTRSRKSASELASSSSKQR